MTGPRTEAERMEQLEKRAADLEKAAKSKKSIVFSRLKEDELNKSESDPDGLEILGKSALNSLQAMKQGGTITRLSFEENPTTYNKYVNFYKPKQNQVPDWLIKRMFMRDDLFAQCCMARASQISAFGHKVKDRFSTGIRIKPKKGVMEKLNEKQKQALNARIAAATSLLLTCGSTENLEEKAYTPLSKFLYEQALNAVRFGRFATEIIHLKDQQEKPVEFHSFKSSDVATIFQSNPIAKGVDRVRKEAFRLIQQLENKKLDPEKFVEDGYDYIQVIDSIPRQAFTEDELYVQDVYPITDIELVGYPITPADIALDAILTHMNITSHNKLYFQSGRAARGMIVIKSADINQDIVGQIREHFNASINSVQNSWRVPVFGIDQNDDVSWQPLEFQGSRDQEFQFLSDSVSRVVMGAFQLGPEEVPGYGHLAKPTGPQGLSESDNEWKLEAARDVGLRPLVLLFEAFFNDRLLPLIDAELAPWVELEFHGLEQDTPERENARIQAEAGMHATYDEILGRVEKPQMGARYGGSLPLNAAVQANFDKYLTVGEIEEHFLGVEGAAKDPKKAYKRDSFYFNFLQLQMQQDQMKQQQDMMNQQAQQEQAGQQPPPSDDKPPENSELVSGVDQALELLGKSERNLMPNKRKLLAQHNATVKDFMDEWEKESIQAREEVLATAKKTKAKKN